MRDRKYETLILPRLKHHDQQAEKSNDWKVKGSSPRQQFKIYLLEVCPLNGEKL